MSSAQEIPKTIIKKSASSTEMKPSTPDIPSPYTPEEAEVVARMKGLINHDIYVFARVHTLEDSRDSHGIPEAILSRRREIVDELQVLVQNILKDRNKEKKVYTFDDFTTFVDEHIDAPEYRFLGTMPDTLNKNGWGFFGGLLHPLEMGIKIGPNIAASRPSNWRSGR